MIVRVAYHPISFHVIIERAFHQLHAYEIGVIELWNTWEKSEKFVERWSFFQAHQGGCRCGDLRTSSLPLPTKKQRLSQSLSQYFLFISEPALCQPACLPTATSRERARGRSWWRRVCDATGLCILCRTHPLAGGRVDLDNWLSLKIIPPMMLASTR